MSTSTKSALGIVNDVLVSASSCQARLHRVALARVEARAGGSLPGVLWAEVQPDVASAWESIAALRAQLEPHVQRYAATLSSEAPASNDPLAFALATSPAPASTVRPTGTIDDRLGESAWSTSFVLHSEIDGFQKRLGALLRLPDGWELVDALQEHIARLTAGIDALRKSLKVLAPCDQSHELATDVNPQLAASRELRTRVFELRDAILEIERALSSKPPSMWCEYLEDAQRRIDAFMFSPGFNWLWAADKRAFLRQRAGLHDVMALWTPLRAEPARQAVVGLARYLEAMQVINRRECIVAHDRRALGRVVAELEASLASSGQASREALSCALASLAEAAGRDRELDHMLSQCLRPGEELKLDALLDRARLVLEEISAG